MAAPSVVARGGGAVAATTSHNIAIPAAPTAGNLLIIIFRRNGTQTGSTITFPVGWTQIPNPGSNPGVLPVGFGSGVYTEIWAKVAAASETTPVVVTTGASVTSAHRWFEIDAWSGEFDGIRTAASAQGFSTLPDPPNNTYPTTHGWNDNEILSIAVAVNSGNTVSASVYPTSYINGATHQANGAGIASAERQITALSENPSTFTISGNASWTALTILIRNNEVPAPLIDITQQVLEVGYSALDKSIDVTAAHLEVTYSASDKSIDITQLNLEVAYIESSGTSYYYYMTGANDMPIPLRHATASQTKTISPFISSGDFIAPMTALTIANTDIKLMKNGAAAVNKNSGGATHLVNGEYAMTLDATDTNTVGELKVSVYVAGALVACKTCLVVEEVVFDALYAADAPGFLGTGALTTINTINTNLDTVDTNVDTVITMLGDIQGDTFNAAIHNLENIYNTLSELSQALVPASAVPSLSTLVTGISVSGVTADMVSANNTRRVVTPTTGGLSLVIEYELGVDRLPTGLDIQGYYNAAGAETIKVDAYNFVTASYDRISVPGATEIPNGVTDIDYQYYLSRQHVNATGLVQIRLTTTTETNTYELHVDRAIVYHVDAVAIGAGLTAAEVWNYHRRRLTDSTGTTVPVENIIRSGETRTIARAGKPSIAFTETRS